MDWLVGSSLATRLKAKAAEMAEMIDEHGHDNLAWNVLTDSEKQEVVMGHFLVKADLFDVARHLFETEA